MISIGRLLLQGQFRAIWMTQNKLAKGYSAGEACCGLGLADISKAGVGGQSSEPTWDRQRKEETTTVREGAAVLMPVRCELMRDQDSHYDKAPFTWTLVAAHPTLPGVEQLQLDDASD